MQQGVGPLPVLLYAVNKGHYKVSRKCVVYDVLGYEVSLGYYQSFSIYSRHLSFSEGFHSDGLKQPVAGGAASQ